MGTDTTEGSAGALWSDDLEDVSRDSLQAPVEGLALGCWSKVVRGRQDMSTGAGGRVDALLSLFSSYCPNFLGEARASAESRDKGGSVGI